MVTWGFPGGSAGEKSACNAGESSLIPGSGRCAGEGRGYPLQYSWASLVAQLVKKSTCNVGDLGSILGLGISPGEGKGYPLQYSGLENSTDCIVHGVAKSRTRLSDCHIGTSLVVQWLGLGSIPGQGTRSHITQLNIPPAAMKDQRSRMLQL